MQRLPRTLFFILAHTESVLRWMAHCRFGDFVRFGATDVDNHQTQGATNGGIGTKTVSERVMATVDTNLLYELGR